LARALLRRIRQHFDGSGCTIIQSSLVHTPETTSAKDRREIASGCNDILICEVPGTGRLYVNVIWFVPRICKN
jgi:hypothetical protein